MPEWDEARSLEQLREALAEWNEYLIRRAVPPSGSRTWLRPC
jgi:hypothetical protein